jgi:predicted  nucleic acid-binding Zn-ribbon protein
MNIPVEQFQATNETIDVLSEGVKVLDNDIERVGSECVHSQNALQPITQELPNIKKSVDEQNVFVDNMKTEQDANESDVLLMKQQLENRKSANYDGTFIWKITDVKEKIGE